MPEDKTEAILGSVPRQTLSLYSVNRSVEVGSSTVQPSAVVRDIELHLEMKQHVAKVAAVFQYMPCVHNVRAQLQGLKNIIRDIIISTLIKSLG